MGCWNATCFVTNLPIFSGEDVVCILVTEQNGYEKGNHCYPTGHMLPFGLTFNGKYNEYGALERCTGIGLTVLLDYIKEKLVEMDEGENKYHDIPVKRDDFNVEKLFDAIHECRLFIKDKPIPFFKFPPQVGVKHLYIKKSVFNKLVKTMKLGEHTFSTLKTDIPMVIEYVKNASLEETLFERYGDSHLGRIIRNIQESGHSSVDRLLFLKIFNFIRTHDNHNEIAELLENVLSYIVFYKFMVSSRRSFHSPSGVGSQDDNTKGQELVANIILKEVKLIKQRFEE